MDLEQVFICALLTATKQEQQVFFSRQIPQNIFRQREPEMTWITEYRTKFGRYPSARVFFSRFKWPIAQVEESLDEALSAVVGQEQYRQIKQVVEHTRELVDQGKDMSKVIGYFRQEASILQVFEYKADDIDFSKDSGAYRRYLDVLTEKKKPNGKLYTSPWPKLNTLVKFFRPEELVLLVGRLGMGKSWLQLFWALYLAEHQTEVLMVSKEMSVQQMADRVEAMKYKLEWEALRGGTLKPADILRWRRLRMKHKSMRLIFTGREDMKGTGFDEIVRKVEEYHPQVVFVDAAYRIAATEVPKNANDTTKLAYIAQTSKRLAKSYKIMVCVSTQMNRGAEQDGSTKGNVGQVFGSDAWAQEADAAFEVWGKRQVTDQRVLSVLKGREFKGAADIGINFTFSPYPDFSEMSNSQLLASTPKVKFTGI